LFRKLFRIGSKAVSVFPVPVGANSKTFLPSSMSGITSFYGGVGVVIEASLSACLICSEKLSKRDFWAKQAKYYVL